MNWEDYIEIAEMLEAIYPNSPVDAISLSKSELKEMIISLPGFINDADEAEADYHAKFIRNAWVDIRIPKTYHVNDSAYL